MRKRVPTPFLPPPSSPLPQPSLFPSLPPIFPFSLEALLRYETAQRRAQRHKASYPLSFDARQKEDENNEILNGKINETSKYDQKSILRIKMPFFSHCPPWLRGSSVSSCKLESCSQPKTHPHPHHPPPHTGPAPLQTQKVVYPGQCARPACLRGHEPKT